MHDMQSLAGAITDGEVQVDNTSYFADQQQEAGDLGLETEESDEDEGEEGADDSDTSQDNGEKSGEKADDNSPFTAKQQERVNNIVQQRLDRQEQKLLKDMASSAGVPIEKGEINDAARLWGLLKVNPSLSQQIDAMIDAYVAQNPTAVPQGRQGQTGDDLKSAVLDMRANDAVFNKHHKAVMDWADEQGYDVRDAQTLKLVYGAWKNSNPQNLVRKQPNGNQGKAPAKAGKAAPVQTKTTGAGQTAGRQVDPRKLSDRDFLATKGLNLFTE